MTQVYRPDKVHRVIIKISGEVLAGNKGFGHDHQTIESLTEDIIEIKRLGMSVGVVLGGGNIFRGIAGARDGIDRVTADNVGMLATIQNSLILSSYLTKRNYDWELYSAIQVDKVAKFYTPSRAETSLKEGKICLFCGGTGNPYFTTDTAAVLRAIELNADLVLKGTKVDGVYSADPMKDDQAEFIGAISFEDALRRKLQVMDMTAFSLAGESGMPIKVFNITQKGNIREAVLNRGIGTYVHP